MKQSTNDDLYEGRNTAGNPGWLSGSFNARKVGQGLQFWDNGGSLGMIAYGTAKGAGAAPMRS